MAKPQSDIGEFLLGPCGEKQEVVEARWAGPWRTPCKVAPSFIHLVGSVGLQREHGFSRPPTAQQPQNSQPFDSPLMLHEDLLCPAPRNVCPS